MDDDTIYAKLILLGDSFVGKTSIINSYKGRSFDIEEKPTIGATFSNITTSANGKEIKLAIWDTAGQETYRSLAPTYYRDANMAIIVFAVNDETSFNSVQEWVNQVREAAPNIKMLICGNKIDLSDERIISYDQSLQLANNLKLSFIEVSAKTGQNIQEAFQTLVDEYVKGYEPLFRQPVTNVIVDETNKSESQNNDKRCCH